MNFIEVCAGCGGMSSGLILAGFIPLLLNDCDKDACETLRLNHPRVDIRQCPLQELNLTSYRDTVDLLVGGIPCQSFSYAGKGKGLDDERGTLFFPFMTRVSECLPKMFLIENVKGIVSNKNGTTFQTLLTLLKMNGRYDVTFTILNAKYS